MVKQIGKGGKLKTAYWSIVAMISGLIISVQPMFAANETIWDRFSTIMQDIYGQIVGISTIVAVTVAAVALVVRMVSRNQRAVDEATSWLIHRRLHILWVLQNQQVRYSNPGAEW